MCAWFFTQSLLLWAYWFEFLPLAHSHSTKRTNSLSLSFINIFSNFHLKAIFRILESLYAILGIFEEDHVEPIILEELLVVYPLPKMLHIKSASDFIVCLHIISCPLVWHPSLKSKCIYISCTPYTHSLKVILYNVFNNVLHITKFHGTEFSPCDIFIFKSRMINLHDFYNYDLNF